MLQILRRRKKVFLVVNIAKTTTGALVVNIATTTAGVSCFKYCDDDSRCFLFGYFDDGRRCFFGLYGILLRIFSLQLAGKFVIY